jgi:hypothetical protein
MMTNRTFGVEIECIGITAEVALSAIRATGLPCEIEGYNHNTRSHWKITTDSSVRDNRGNPGIEVVSPILSGTAGMTALKTVADALNAAGATANKTCGIHVHVGASDLSIDEIKMIVKRYSSFETVIDSYMPVSRRASNNQYLKSMSDWSAYYGAALAECQTVAAMSARGWDRYYKINLAAFVRQGTIEFRQHSGSVSSEKIGNWVLFVLNFVEVSRQLVASVSPAPVARRRGRPAGRSNARDKGLFKIVRELHTAGSASQARLAEVSGYSVTSIPACISEIRRKWSLRITKSRLWGTYRANISYTTFLTIEQSVTTGTSTPVVRASVGMPTISVDDHALSGLSAGVVSYFNERAMELAA